MSILVPDWRYVIKRAWSFKANAALVIVGLLQSAFAVYGEPLIGAALSGAVMALFGSASMILRIIAQKEAEDAVGAEAKP